MKVITTRINPETYRKLEIAAAARNLTVAEALLFLAQNGVRAFITLNGGVHQ